MYRVCLEKLTGKLIEMQSGGKEQPVTEEQVLIAVMADIVELNRNLAANKQILQPTQTMLDQKRNTLTKIAEDYEAANLNTLKQNAINAGYTSRQIEVKFVDETEWQSILAANTPSPTYAELRAREYPPITDYLDGVVKGDQAQIDAYIAACLAVKEKYPKE